MEGYGTYMAMVAEVSLVGGEVKVHKVTVEAQIQSSVVLGLGAAVMRQITLVNGRVQQTNYNSFPVVRMNETPVMDIMLVQSTEKPGGIGEPATALVAPAIANAVFKLTGKRLRSLPYERSRAEVSVKH